MNKRTAIVLGAGISGLLNARVLSDYFDNVIVLERDDVEQSRQGTPQDRHIHQLLAKGYLILTDLFPHISEEFTARNLPEYSWTKDIYIVTSSGVGLKYDSGISGYSVSRPYLESIIRNQTEKSLNVTLKTDHRVEALLMEDGSIVGVKTTQGTIHGNLILDATGRQSKTPLWLAQLGYQQPKVSTVDPQMGYATRWYTIPTSVQLPVPSTIVQPRYRDHFYRGAAGVIVENRKVVITMLGTNRDYPPTDENGFRHFAQSLPDPIIVDWIDRLEPISPIYGFRAVNRMYHYDKLKLPDNLLITGDAFCTFNPFYGQGMTVIAMQAKLLQKFLTQRKLQKPSFSNKYHRAQARLVQTAWLMATLEDLRNPKVLGATKRFYHKLAQRYIDKLISAFTDDIETSTIFLEVMHFMKHPIHLVHPRILWKILIKSQY